MVNYYQHSIDGFESTVFNCGVTIGGFGMSLVSKKIVHRLDIKYPPITLPL